MNIDTKALKGIIEEIEASKARQKGEAEFQREAIKRAVKQHQLDGKAIRIVLQRRAMGDEKRDEQDYYVHAYEMALGGKKLAADALASGATIREAAAIGGISTGAAGNLAKVVQKSAKLDKPEDGDDGITESRTTHGMQASDSAPQGSPMPVAPKAAEVTSLAGPPVPQGGEGTGTYSVICTADGDDGITGGEDERAEEGQDQGAGQGNGIYRQPDAGNAGAGPIGSGGLGAGQDDSREDGGGVRGIGAAQDQLINPAPQGCVLPGPPEANGVGASFATPAPNCGVGTGTHSDDDLAIPTFLRGSRQGRT